MMTLEGSDGGLGIIGVNNHSSVDIDINDDIDDNNDN